MVELDRYGPGDRELTLTLEGDPRVMEHLGGPRSPEDLDETHARRIATEESGGAWYAIVVTGEDAAPAQGPRRVGEIGMFRAERNGEELNEIGWSLLPEYQGRGIGKRALELLLSRLEAEFAPMTVVATPATSNGASNGLCRSFGFDLAAEGIEITFRDQAMICNEWRLRLPRGGD